MQDHLGSIVVPDFMTLGMWFVWLLRSDIRGTAHLADEQAQRDFVGWWLFHGHKEYPAIWRILPIHARIAMEAQPGPHGLRCPRLLLWVREGRGDLREAFPLDEMESVADFLCWYRIYGASELPFAPALPEPWLSLTEAPSARAPWNQEPTVPRMAVAAWRRDKGLLQGRSPEDPTARKILVNWHIASLSQTAGIGTIHSRQTSLHPPKLTSGGVNLIGFVRAASGLGEDARMALAALDAAGIPVALIDVPPGPATSTDDDSLASRIETQPRFDISLYCMSAFDMAALATRRGTRFFAGQYRIGYWPWELPRFPDPCRPMFALVHEIWAGSQFTADAYRDAGRPAHCLPCPIVVPPVHPADRAMLGLHNPGAFTFTYAFDPNSYLARKNPIALVQAFAMAFPPSDRSVALLLRLNGEPADSPATHALISSIAKDDRITITTRRLTRDAATSMLKTCDCLVSPHRAEGFGRNIAEAIAIGLPVLATGYSGNVDYLEASEQIAYKLRPVSPGEYPFADGLDWADVDIIDLVEQMQKIRTSLSGEKRRMMLNERAQKVIDRYSPISTGLQFRQRLCDIDCTLPRYEFDL